MRNRASPISLGCTAPTPRPSPSRAAELVIGPAKGRTRWRPPQDDGEQASSRILATHPRPSFAKCRHDESAKESRATEKEGVVPAFSLSAYARFATRKKMKGYGTPTDALSNLPCCWHGRALSRARTPIGVPPRLWPRRDLLPRALLQATFPGTWNWRRSRNDPHSWGGTDAVFAGVTRLHLSQSSEHLAPQSVVLGG